MTQESMSGQAGVPDEPAPIPKIYVSGTPTPDTPIGTLEVDDKVLVTVYATVTKKGLQHQKQGKSPFINLNVYEIDDIRPL